MKKNNTEQVYSYQRGKTFACQSFLEATSTKFQFSPNCAPLKTPLKTKPFHSLPSAIIQTLRSPFPNISTPAPQYTWPTTLIHITDTTNSCNRSPPIKRHALLTRQSKTPIHSGYPSTTIKKKKKQSLVLPPTKQLIDCQLEKSSSQLKTRNRDADRVHVSGFVLNSIVRRDKGREHGFGVCPQRLDSGARSFLCGGTVVELNESAGR